MCVMNVYKHGMGGTTDGMRGNKNFLFRVVWHLHLCHCDDRLHCLELRGLHTPFSTIDRICLSVLLIARHEWIANSRRSIRPIYNQSVAILLLICDAWALLKSSTLKWLFWLGIEHLILDTRMRGLQNVLLLIYVKLGAF